MLNGLIYLSMPEDKYNPVLILCFRYGINRLFFLKMSILLVLSLFVVQKWGWVLRPHPHSVHCALCQNWFFCNAFVLKNTCLLLNKML